MSWPKIGVLLAEGRLLEVQQEGLPLGRGADAGDQGGQEAHAQAAPPDPLAHGLASRLEQVAGRRDAEARRQAARKLDVELHDHEEDRECRNPDEHLPPEPRPEHGAEADLAEPQPVDIEPQHPPRYGEQRHDERDDYADDDATPALTRRLARHTGTQVADVVHAPSMSGSRGFHTRGACDSPAWRGCDAASPPSRLPESPEGERCRHGGPALADLQQIPGHEEHRATG